MAAVTEDLPAIATYAQAARQLPQVAELRLAILAAHLVQVEQDRDVRHQLRRGVVESRRSAAHDLALVVPDQGVPTAAAHPTTLDRLAREPAGPVGERMPFAIGVQEPGVGVERLIAICADDRVQAQRLMQQHARVPELGVVEADVRHEPPVARDQARPATSLGVPHRVAVEPAGGDSAFGSSRSPLTIAGSTQPSALRGSMCCCSFQTSRSSSSPASPPAGRGRPPPLSVPRFEPRAGLARPRLRALRAAAFRMSRSMSSLSAAYASLALPSSAALAARRTA